MTPEEKGEISQLVVKVADAATECRQNIASYEENEDEESKMYEMGYLHALEWTLNRLDDILNNGR